MTVDRNREDIVFRNPTPDELSAWLTFLREEIFPEDSCEDVMSLWEKDREKDRKGIFLAVDPEGRIAGSVKAECRRMSFNDFPVFTGIISGAGVKKEYRGRGIAGRLFGLCHGYLKEKGVEAAYLYSEPDTLSFYRHLGYLERAKRPEDSFYRMFYLIRPFEMGGTEIRCTKDLIGLLEEE